MLSPEANERLTRVGPGTPCGELMRRYWIPILPTSALRENPVRKVRILCEDLVLYRDTAGNLGLIGDRCLHRLVDMQYGIPDERVSAAPITAGSMARMASASTAPWKKIPASAA